MPAKVPTNTASRIVVFAQEMFDIGLNVLGPSRHVIPVNGSPFTVDEEFLEVPANVAVPDWVVMQPLGVLVVVPSRWTFLLEIGEETVFRTAIDFNFTEKG